MACPDPIALSAYREGFLPQAAAEDLARHCAQCHECQKVLLCLGRASAGAETRVPDLAFDRLLALDPSARSLRWGWSVAAAALLLLASLGWLASRNGLDRLSPAPAPFPEVSRPGGPGFPMGSLGSEAVSSVHLIPGAELLLEPGGRVLADSGGRRLRVESGVLWLDVVDGKPVDLAFPGAILTLRQGTVLVSVPIRSGCSWIREATAGDGRRVPDGISILRGEAQVSAAGRTWILRAGARQCQASGSSVRERLSAREMEGLRDAWVDAGARCPGRALLPCGLRFSGDRSSAYDGVPPAYRFVTVLASRDSSTELELTVGLGGEWYRWVVGLAAAPARFPSQEVVEVIWDGSWLKGRVNGREAFSCDRRGIGKILASTRSRGWGVSALGGEILLQRCLLQEAP